MNSLLQVMLVEYILRQLRIMKLFPHYYGQFVNISVVHLIMLHLFSHEVILCRSSCLDKAVIENHINWKPLLY